MRHRKKINHLSRKSPHRKAMLGNMAASLILKKGITTTVAKAKVLRTFIEPLITKSKEDSTHNRRLVFSKLSNKEAVAELFREIASKIAQRPGGYTRILKIGSRLGDNAKLCRIELVDYNENMLKDKATAKAKSIRTRRGSAKKKETTEVKKPKSEKTVKDKTAVISNDSPAEKVVNAKTAGTSIKSSGEQPLKEKSVDTSGEESGENNKE